jgi:hypothetical protein
MAHEKKSYRKKKQKAKTLVKSLKLVLLFATVALANVYFVLGVLYKGGNFTINLESKYSQESGLVIFENLSERYERTYLKAESIDSFMGISVDWLPSNIDDEADGSHNGLYYIAYTFYAENQGQETINYWAQITIDDVIKNVDEAIRVKVYTNGEAKVYGKETASGNLDVKTTDSFVSDDTIMLEHRTGFEVGEIDKYTIVIFLEGDDPQCTDELLGGSIKMHMTLTEEHEI